MDRVPTVLLFPFHQTVFICTLKYYEVQQGEGDGMRCNRSLTVTGITRQQNENKQIRID